jgi:hypothetical protein
MSEVFLVPLEAKVTIAGLDLRLNITAPSTASIDIAKEDSFCKWADLYIKHLTS